MPQLEVTTKAAEKVWEKGDLAIFKLTLEWDGKEVSAKTYSKAIANVGWSGEVVTYEKPGRDGSETFVKQPPKENPGYGSTSGGSSRSGSGYTPKDEKAIQAMWSISQAIALAPGQDPLNKHVMSAEERLSEVESYAQELFAMVARVKVSEDAAEAPEIPVKPDTVVDPSQVTLEDIGKALGDAEPVVVPLEETPWPPKT